MQLHDISNIGKYLPDPVGRKYALNIALSDNSEIDPIKMRKLFSPNKFMIKITPLHATDSSTENSLQTTDGYEEFTPYQEKENNLKNEGFDVLVFIPSPDEDESRITCGNAILSGTVPMCDFKELTI